MDGPMDGNTGVRWGKAPGILASLGWLPPGSQLQFIECFFKKAFEILSDCNDTTGKQKLNRCTDLIFLRATLSKTTVTGICVSTRRSPTRGIWPEHRS
jgi:hypothetical protein